MSNNGPGGYRRLGTDGSGRPRRPETARYLARWLLAAASLVGALACAGPEGPVRGTRGYLLISIDTLRADHLGCYGYERDTSPFLDSLAARGALFLNAFVQLPGTLPSHMSIFTGLYPAEHGVFPPGGVLSPEIETLPEAFRRHGFRTAGHSEGGYVHGGYGFARGFEEFSHEARKIETDVERTLDRGLDFLRRLEEDDPFFLFLHTYVVHDPYFPADEYRKLYWQGPPPDVPPATGPNLVALNRGEGKLTEEGLRFYRAAYDSSINYADDVLKGFFAELEKLGLMDETTIVITSDHGEAFLEHGKLLHEQIYPEALRVPLIVLHPAVAPRRISSIVRSIDIAPTFHQIAGLKPRTRPSGESLAPLLAGGAERDSEAFAMSHSRQERTLVEKRGSSFHQLVLSQQDTGEGVWVSGTSREFDTFRQELDFEVRGYFEPDELRITIDGEVVDTVELRPDAWTAVELALGATAGKRRVRLSSSRCTVPAEVGGGEDRRCLAFRIRGVQLLLVELFDLAADPLGADDLSGRQGDLARRLISRFDDYEREPIATSDSRDLDFELREHLKALGYLQ